MLAVLALLTMARADLDAAGWKASFESYDRQSPQGQRRILASIVQFSDRFTNVAATIPGCPTIADRMEALSAVLVEHFPKDKLESGKAFERKLIDLVKPMDVALQRGLASKNRLTRAIALDTLFQVARKRFQARKDPFTICRGIPLVDTSRLTGVVSRAMRKQALLEPQLFIRAAEAGNHAAAISLAESRVEAAKSVVSKFIDNDQTFFLGCECAIAWPAPEFLPKLLARIDTVDYDKDAHTYSVFRNALLGYSSSVLKAFQTRWAAMSTLGKRTALDLAYVMPNRLSVSLTLWAMRESSTEVRLLGIQSAMACLDDFPFRSSYTGICPDDLLDIDKVKIREALIRLQNDPNAKVAEAARALCRTRS